MTDRDPLPPEEEAVRDLLAGARVTEPVPPAVAARIDAVLADLAAERAGDAPVAPTAVPPVPDAAAGPAGAPAAVHRPSPATPHDDELARRRRRRRGWLAAAAAVVVVGLGAPVLDDVLAGSGEDSGEASTAADTAGSDAGGAEAEAESEAESAGPGAAPGASDGPGSPGLPRLTAAGFPDEVRDLLADPARSPAGGGLAADAVTACDPGPGPGDEVVLVRYDGRDAALLVRDPDADRTVVDLVVCGRPGIARSTLVER